MALNSSGPISLAGSTAGVSIAAELGKSATGQISLNDADVRSLAGKSSGAIIMPTDFYGKSNDFSFTISTNQTNANLRTLAVNAGWDQSSKVLATIASGVFISSNSTATPALTINGSFPNGVVLTNNGTIAGMGGAGGTGGGGNIITSPSFALQAIAGSVGSTGGLALSVSVAVTINNTSGTIAGGGGGGGGGAGAAVGSQYTSYTVGGGGGGGGRTGTTNSSGGAGGPATNGNSGNSPGGAGGAGTSSAAGGGGSRGDLFSDLKGGFGGAGGAYGSSGSAGADGVWPDGTARAQAGPYSGGGAGGAISGNSNITYNGTGTRLGAIT